MSAHVHADLIKQWADNTSLEFEYRRIGDNCWGRVINPPEFNLDCEYRVAKQPGVICSFMRKTGAIARVVKGSPDWERVVRLGGLHIKELDFEVMLP